MRVFKLMAIVALLWTGLAQAQLVAGTDYLPVVPAQAVDNAQTIEVTEFFWYGCPHCYHLEGKLNAWRAKLPKNVVFKRIPVMWGAGHEKHAQVYYTLEALGLTEKLHSRVFEVVQGVSKDPVELRDENAFANWAAKQGANRAQVLAAYKSFGVSSQLQRGKQLGQSYGVQGVPAFYVQGKYTTSPSLAKDEDRVFRIMDELIKIESAKLAPVASPASKAVKKPVAKHASAVKASKTAVIPK